MYDVIVHIGHDSVTHGLTDRQGVVPQAAFSTGTAAPRRSMESGLPSVHLHDLRTIKQQSYRQ